MDDLFAVFASERVAHEFVRDWRWPHGVRCAHCDHDTVYETKGPNPDRLQWKCAGGCGRKFSVTTGTVMERSHIEVRKWLYAARHFAAAKNGMSALEIKRVVGLESYGSAWFMMHRLREGTKSGLASMIGGPGEIVEVDEAYEGGKKRSRYGAPKNKRGRGAEGKKIVIAMAEREGRQIRAVTVADTKRDTLIGTVSGHVDPGTFVVTDSLRSYNGIGDHFAGHATVDHAREFRRGEAHTNNAESFFSLIKSSIRGTYKSIGTKHVDRYLGEFAFRWSTSAMFDEGRCETLIGGLVGRRLFYKAPRGPLYAEHPQRENVLVAS